MKSLIFAGLCALAAPGRAENPAAMDALKAMSAAEAAVPAAAAKTLFAAPLAPSRWLWSEAKQAFDKADAPDADRLLGRWRRVGAVSGFRPEAGTIDPDGLGVDGEGGMLEFTQEKNPLGEVYLYVAVKGETGDRTVFVSLPEKAASIAFASRSGSLDQRKYVCRINKAGFLLCSKETEIQHRLENHHVAYAKVPASAPLKEAASLPGILQLISLKDSTIGMRPGQSLSILSKESTGNPHRLEGRPGGVKAAHFTQSFEFFKEENYTISVAPDAEPGDILMTAYDFYDRPMFSFTIRIIKK